MMARRFAKPCARLFGVYSLAMNAEQTHKMTAKLPQGGCRTCGTSAAIRPQRSIFYRLFDA